MKHNEKTVELIYESINFKSVKLETFSRKKVMRNYLRMLTRPLFPLIAAGPRSLNERLPGLRLSHTSISPHVCFKS